MEIEKQMNKETARKIVFVYRIDPNVTISHLAELFDVSEQQVKTVIDKHLKEYARYKQTLVILSNKFSRAVIFINKKKNFTDDEYVEAIYNPKSGRKVKQD